MKRLLITPCALLLASTALAAGTCTVSTKVGQGAGRITTWTWTAHTDGSLTACPTTDIASNQIGVVAFLETDPGSPAPDVYDVAITDANSAPVTGTQTNRSATVTERVAPTVVGWFYGPLTFTMTNQATNAAQGVVRVYWEAK